MKAVAVNLNLDVSVIPEKVIDTFLMKEPTEEERAEYQKALKAWAARPVEQRGERPEYKKEYKTGAEFVVETIGQAIRQAHPSGNVQSLRRTKKILGELNGALKSEEKQGVALLEPDDYKYIVSAFNKADKWVNSPENAEVVCAIAELLEQKEEVEL